MWTPNQSGKKSDDSVEADLSKVGRPMKNTILDELDNPVQDIIDRGRWFKKHDQFLLEKQLKATQEKYKEQEERT